MYSSCSSCTVWKMTGKILDKFDNCYIIRTCDFFKLQTLALSCSGCKYSCNVCISIIRANNIQHSWIQVECWWHLAFAWMRVYSLWISELIALREVSESFSESWNHETLFSSLNVFVMGLITWFRVQFRVRRTGKFLKDSQNVWSV